MDERYSGFSKSGERPRSLTSIAAAAGVSVSTVSKVLNGRTDVAPETRERVGRMLRRHGYRVASSPGISMVDFLIGPLGSPWADELVRGAVTAAAETEISVIVSRVTSAAEFGRWLRIASARGTLGALSVLYLPDEETLTALEKAHVPLVVIDPPAEPGGTGAGDGSIRSVGTTNWQGGMTATRHLIDLGHHRIAAIGGPDELWSCRARLDGYRSALRRAGLPVSEDLVRSGELCAEDGCRLAGSLLGLADPPTAIVTGNDAQAFGVLQALAARGLRAPADVSVTGFDDVPVATWSAPPLTTVRQPLAAMAATAFWMLTGPAGDASVTARHVELETTLIVRDSTAPPRALGLRGTLVPRQARAHDGAVAAAGSCTRWHRYLRYGACGGWVTCAAGPRRWQRCCRRATPPRSVWLRARSSRYRDDPSGTPIIGLWQLSGVMSMESRMCRRNRPATRGTGWGTRARRTGCSSWITTGGGRAGGGLRSPGRPRSAGTCSRGACGWQTRRSGILPRCQPRPAPRSSPTPGA
jgi:DNA-binding LacI/PurR family transcriptional regulator